MGEMLCQEMEHSEQDSSGFCPQIASCPVDWGWGVAGTRQAGRGGLIGRG